jgi:hypothetical protein
MGANRGGKRQAKRLPLPPSWIFGKMQFVKEGIVPNNDVKDYNYLKNNHVMKQAVKVCISGLK